MTLINIADGWLYLNVVCAEAVNLFNMIYGMGR